MKNLQNILPLYLRQSIIYGDGEVAEFTGIQRLTNSSTILTAWDSAGLERSPGIDSFGKRCWLLLRSLSSMTEDEARGLCEKNTHWFLSMSISPYGDTVIEMEGGALERKKFKLTLSDVGGIWASNRNFCLYLGIIPHLCALGFDCFGLIEKGIAKDSTLKN